MGCIYFGLFGGSVGLGLKTEAETEHRTTQNWKPKPNRKTEKLTFRFGSARFGSVCGFRLKNAHPYDQWLLSSSLKSHKIKMIRMKSGFMFRKERVLT
jgi:hypothetical protein